MSNTTVMAIVAACAVCLCSSSSVLIATYYRIKSGIIYSGQGVIERSPAAITPSSGSTTTVGGSATTTRVSSTRAGGSRV